MSSCSGPGSCAWEPHTVSATPEIGGSVVATPNEHKHHGEASNPFAHPLACWSRWVLAGGPTVACPASLHIPHPIAAQRRVGQDV